MARNHYQKETLEANRMRHNIHAQITYAVRNARRRRNLTQADVARLAGVTQPTVCRAESTYGRCGLGVLARIAAALNVTVVLSLEDES